MTSERLREHYETKYAADAESTGPELIKPGAILSDRFQAGVEFVSRHFQGGDILEIGAGRGDVAHTLLKSLSCIKSYTITDLSSSRVTGLKSTLNDPRVRADVFDVERDDEFLNGGKFDAIIMIALIEHLVDPMGVMKKIRDRLNNEGFVYIDTPNVAKYTNRIKLLFGRFPSTASREEGLVTYDGKQVDLFDEGHLHYFTYRSLSRMLIERCGFSRVVKVGYPGGLRVLGDSAHAKLATVWPEAFSELALLAYR